jgi:hypothetical protein
MQYSHLPTALTQLQLNTALPAGAPAGIGTLKSNSLKKQFLNAVFNTRKFSLS